MKPFPSFLLALLLVAGGIRLHSQIPVKRPVAAELETIRASNVDLLARQQKTIEALQALEKEAAQIKTFGKRG